MEYLSFQDTVPFVISSSATAEAAKMGQSFIMSLKLAFMPNHALFFTSVSGQASGKELV